MSDSPIYEKIIFENEEKGFQLRLVVSEFREVEYLHLRKYFLSYEGIWTPSSEGASMPLSIRNIFNLIDGLVDICAEAESHEVFNEYFKHKLNGQDYRIPDEML